MVLLFSGHYTGNYVSILSNNHLAVKFLDISVSHAENECDIQVGTWLEEGNPFGRALLTGSVPS